MKISARVLALALTVCSLVSLDIACTGRNAKSTSDTATPNVASAGDERSGRSGVASSIVQACDTMPGVTCYRDTARAGTPDDDPGQYPLADWVWFGFAGDSIEISGPPGAAIATSIGQERDSLQNTRRYFRHRLVHDGVLRIFVSLDETQGATVPYTLRVLQSHLASAETLRPTGQTATLTVRSQHKTDAFSLVPVSIASTVRDRSRYRIDPVRYKVALVSDSLYELCRLPCTAPDTVKLTPSANVVKTF